MSSSSLERLDLNPSVASRSLSIWVDEVVHRVFGGAPARNEVVFLHRPSRTLVLTDLAFPVQPGNADRARV